jgi:hypothetical protein
MQNKAYECFDCGFTFNRMISSPADRKKPCAKCFNGRCGPRGSAPPTNALSRPSTAQLKRTGKCSAHPEGGTHWFRFGLCGYCRRPEGVASPTRILSKPGEEACPMTGKRHMYKFGSCKDCGQDENYIARGLQAISPR